MNLTIHITAGAQGRKPFTMVIHGGAGTILKKNMSAEMEQAYRSMLQHALDTGYQILEGGGTSLDAVVAAITVMENSPLFNAGKGSVFAHNGHNEMDASMMEGKTLNAGAVAGVTNIKNPVLAARAVMLHSEHVMLAREGAEAFAREQELEMVDPAYFYTERRKESLERAIEREKEEGSIRWMNEEDGENWKHGTVGAVALDQHGNLAAATSTGGMTNKKYGRIGDSPVIGAGTYADNATCAVSCTGHGEYFIRLAVAHRISALMAYKKLTVEAAGKEVIMQDLEKMGGTGGAIIVDQQGHVAMPFNTEGMYRAFRKSDGTSQVLIYKKE